MTLDRTAEALEAYERHEAAYPSQLADPTVTSAEIDRWLDEAETLSRAVGEAFALETADRNDPDTIRAMFHFPPANCRTDRSWVWLRKQIEVARQAAEQAGATTAPADG